MSSLDLLPLGFAAFALSVMIKLFLLEGRCNKLEREMRRLKAAILGPTKER